MIDSSFGHHLFNAMGIINFISLIIFLVASIILLSKTRQLGSILIFIGSLCTFLTTIAQQLLNMFGHFLVGLDSLSILYYLPSLINSIFYTMIGIGLLILVLSFTKEQFKK